VERDEARHVGLGILHLPQQVAALTAAQRARAARKIHGIGDLFAATQLRYAVHYRAAGLDPQELFRRADRMLCTLSARLGTVPGTDQPYFRTYDPDQPGYQENLDQLFPRDGVPRTRLARVVHGVVEAGARILPA
ncbi:MAG TPA: hypothetical protein VL172_19640, partial [Kofleriaceae bacterium]|nr:hypothetical protein [Kofleriaceae bacterium]